MLKLKAIVLADIRVSPCGMGPDSRLTWDHKGTGLELWLTEFGTVLARRQDFDDAIIPLSACYQVVLEEPFPNAPKVKKPKEERPPSPAAIQAKKTVAARKAEIERAKREAEED